MSTDSKKPAAPPEKPAAQEEEDCDCKIFHEDDCPLAAPSPAQPTPGREPAPENDPDGDKLMMRDVESSLQLLAGRAHRLSGDLAALCIEAGRAADHAPAQPTEEVRRLRDVVRKIINASYAELRPLVEHYGPDPAYGGRVYRSHATPREWEVARAVAAYFQGIPPVGILDGENRDADVDDGEVRRLREALGEAIAVIIDLLPAAGARLCSLYGIDEANRRSGRANAAIEGGRAILNGES